MFDTNYTKGLRHLCQSLVFIAVFALLSGCQTLRPAKLNTLRDSDTAIQNAFRINGKIGFSFKDSNNQKKRQTVFYAWVQKNDAYHIDLSGALGIGKTQIYGNNQSATIETKNSKTGEKQQISAKTPESLLYKVTKLQAPISDFPYWIMGKPTRNATANTFDEKNRLLSSISQSPDSNWQVSLTYEDGALKPRKIKVLHQPIQTDTTKVTNKNSTFSNQVIMTINHIN